MTHIPTAFLIALLTCSFLHADSFQPVREMEVEGQRVLIDNTNTRLKLSVVTETESHEDAELTRALFPSYAAAANAVGGGEVLPSVSLIYAKGKAIDDGTYAAVELAAETDFGPLQMGKPVFFRAVIDSILREFPQQSAPRDRVLTYLASALAIAQQLDRDSTSPGVTLSLNVGRKPIGFYTWSSELEGIFRRDTALQVRFDPNDQAAETALLAMAVQADPDLRAEYDRVNALYASLTNPLNGLTVGDVISALPDGAGAEVIEDGGALRKLRREIAGNPGLALLQPSRSKEMSLLWVAAANGLSSMEQLIAAVRDGRIDLAPDAECGWYEYQQYALEPLLVPDTMPEGEKLTLTEEYRELLEAHFRAMLTNIRETHVKQLEVMLSPPPPLEVAIRPHLECEPIATTYLRLGDAYEFLRDDVLREHLGEEALTDLHALSEGAEPRDASLGDELTEMQRLMQGAYLLTCRDIGLQPEISGDLQSRMDEAQQWLRNWRDDPDMQRDVRMMIPVSRYPDVYWAVIGVGLAKVDVIFESPPDVRAADPRVNVNAMLSDASYWVPVEEFIEIEADGGTEPLNRTEFRALCDQYRTPEEIKAALETRLQSRMGWRKWLWHAAIVFSVALIPVAWLSFKSYQREGWIGLLPLLGVIVVLVTIAVTLLRG